MSKYTIRRGYEKMRTNRVARAALSGVAAALLLAVCLVFSASYKDLSGGGWLTVCFAKETYIISYDANGGTGAPEPQTKNGGESINLSKTVPVRDGHVFVGWSTDKFDDTVRFMPGDRFSYDTSLKLYAVWKNATHEHIYIDEIIEPTCTERGYTKHTCTVCNHVEIDSYVQATRHAAKTEKAVAATCTEEGRTEGLRCMVCGVVVKGIEPVKALGHDIEIDEKEVKPTCVENGLTAGGRCKRCGYKSERKTIPALGHNLVRDEAKEATCTKSGCTRGEHCTRCDYKTGGQKLPALGHSYVIDEAKNATCTESGLTAGKHCTRCGYRQAQNVIAALGHKMIQDEAKEPTCTQSGYTSGEHCARCNYRTGHKTVAALGHDFKTGKAVPPTCTKTGLTEGKVCKRCGLKTEQKTVPALGHYIVVDAAKDATCTESGLTAGKHCTRCDYRTAQNVIAPLGHDIATDKAKEPTCTEPGLSQGKHCKRCSYKVAQKSIPALGHKLVEVAGKKPTCTKSGCTAWQKCERCSYKTESKTVPATGHYIINDTAKSATCTKSGLTAGKHCTRCDYRVEQDVIAPLGHSMVEDKKQEATCTRTGLEKGSHCKRCGFKTSRKVIPKKAHSYVKNVKRATTSKDGLIAYRCSMCNALKGKAQVVFMIKSAVLSKTSFVYTGKAAAPEYIVKDRNNNSLKAGRDYVVTYSGNKTVGKALAKITFKGNYQGEKTLSFRILPAAAKKLSVTKITSSSLKAAWSKVYGASGYKASLYKNGSCVRTVDTAKNSVVFKNLDSGSKYTVKIQAYVYIGSTKAYSPRYKSVNTATKAAAPKLAVSAEKKQARLSWSKISGAKSYAVYYSTNKNSGFKKITSSANHRVIKKLKTGERYYFKVIAVKNKKNGPQYTAFSNTVSAVIK